MEGLDESSTESVLGADGIRMGGESSKIFSNSSTKKPGGGGWVISEGGTGAFGHSTVTVCTSGSGLGVAQPVSETSQINGSVSSRVGELDAGRLDSSPLDALYLVGTFGCLQLYGEALAGCFRALSGLSLLVERLLGQDAGRVPLVVLPQAAPVVSRPAPDRDAGGERPGCGVGHDGDHGVPA